MILAYRWSLALSLNTEKEPKSMPSSTMSPWMAKLRSGLAALLISVACYTSMRAADAGESSGKISDSSSEVSIGGQSFLVYKHDPREWTSYFGPIIDKRQDYADLSEGGGRILSCSSLVEVPVTRIEHGFGGDCLFQDRQGRQSRAFICGDTAVGRFYFTRKDRLQGPDADLATFTAGHCSGG